VKRKCVNFQHLVEKENEKNMGKGSNKGLNDAKRKGMGFKRRVKGKLIRVNFQKWITRE